MRKSFSWHGRIETIGQMILHAKHSLYEVEDTCPVLNDGIGQDWDKTICMPSIMHGVLISHDLEIIPIGRNQLTRGEDQLNFDTLQNIIGVSPYCHITR